MYSSETMEVLNQPVEAVKVKRTLSDEHKAKMAEGRKKKKELKEFLKDANVIEEEEEEEIIMEGVSPPIVSEKEVAVEIEKCVDEISPKTKVDETVPPKWFAKYLKEKEVRRKKKQGMVKETPKVGKVIVPEDKEPEKPAVVHHLMKSIFPNRYK